MVLRALVAVVVLLALSKAALAQEAIRKPPPECERLDWNQERNDYGADPCVTALAFDPSVYFGQARGSTSPLGPPAHLVDARFIDAFDGNWLTFAIGFDQQRLLFRAVIVKRMKEMSPGWKYEEPHSMADAKRLLPDLVKWQEADLRACPGAVRKLLALENVKWLAFDETDRNRIKSAKAPEAITVVADRDTVIVRARGFALDSAAADGGGAAEWAREMYDLVTPCLKSATAPPPWEG